MKTKAVWVMALWAAGLSAGSAIVGCTKETAPNAVSAADQTAADKAAADKALATKAAADKSIADKALADKAIADKAIADKALADKAAADKAAADKAVADKAAASKAAADKAAGEKAAADKAVADKVAADKAAADKAAAQANAEAAALPTDLVQMKAEITRSMAQLDLTMAKLESLSTATGDLDKPSKDVLAAIEALELETKALKARGDEMRNRGAAYFEAWEKQLAAMSTPEVVEVATKRKDELSAKYAELLTAMQECRASLDAYWADMKPIREAVDDGLTPDSQKLLVTQVKSAKEKAVTLKSRTETMFAKVNQVSLIYANR